MTERHVGRTTKALVGLSAAAALLVGAASAATATSQAAARRLAGADRYETAAAIATATYTTTRTAVVASGVNFPDAQAAAFVAGLNVGPVLLTDPNNLSSSTQSALASLQVKGVQVAGGSAAVSDNVVNQLKALGYTVDRLAGANRYGTAAAMATAGGTDTVGSFPGKGKTALLATGTNFPDALASGPLAYFKALPVLLTDPNSLSPEAQSAMTSLGVKYVVILGGTNAVSSNVETSLTGMGITFQRVAGATRQDTAAMIADLELSTFGFNQNMVNLARGDDFPDALTGGPHGGAGRSPILLTNSPNDLSPASRNWLSAHVQTLTQVDVFGGAAAISDATVNAAVAAAQGQ